MITLNYKAIPALIALMLMNGCSSEPELKPIGPVVENFATHISDDGTKLFRYTMMLATPNLHYLQDKPSTSTEPQAQPEPSANPNSSGNDMPAIRRNRDEPNPLEAQMLVHLEQILKQNHYCADKYYELSRIVMDDRAELRGECHEGATDADKVKFPNK